jgi:heme A synthase
VGTSKGWREDAEFPRLSSRIFALLPFFVLGQTILGAVYRHTGETSWLMWHLTGALIFAIGVFWAGIAVLTEEGCSVRLKRTAVSLFLLLGVQLTLGVLAWIQRIRTEDLAIIPWTRAHIASVHVLIGSLFMAACVYLYLHARRPVSLQPV